MIHEQDLGQHNVDWIDRPTALAEFGITKPDQKGDVAGHGFHGNRWTGGIGGGEETPKAPAYHTVNLKPATRQSLVAELMLATMGGKEVSPQDYLMVCGKYALMQQDADNDKLDKEGTNRFYELQETMGEYETSAAWLMNMELRAGTDPSLLGLDSHSVADIDAAFKEFGAAFEEDKTVYRGAIMEPPTPGEVYHDEAFLSTIPTPGEAVYASSNSYAQTVGEHAAPVEGGASTVWEINIPAGQEVLGGRPDEVLTSNRSNDSGEPFMEVVLNRGADLQVESVTKKAGGVYVVKATYLGSHPAKPDATPRDINKAAKTKVAPDGTAWRFLWLPGDMTITSSDENEKGDMAGHEFHGNRWTGGIGGMDSATHDVYAAETDARNRIGAGAHFENIDKASEYAAKVYDAYAPANAAYRSNATLGSPIEVRFEGEPNQSGVARVAEGGSVRPYPVIRLGDGMHDQLTVIHEVAHIIANEREQGLGPWKANHGGVFRDTFRHILQGEMLAHAQMIKAFGRVPGQKGEGGGHAFRGNRWTGGIGAGGKVTGPPKLVSSKVKPSEGPKGLTYEKLNPSQHMVIKMLYQDLDAATKYGWKANADYSKPASPLYPEYQTRVIAGLAGLTSAGLSHEELIRSLAFFMAGRVPGSQFAKNSSNISHFTLATMSKQINFLETIAKDPEAIAKFGTKFNEYGLKIPEEKIQALAGAVRDQIEEEKFVAQLRESQGAHILGDPAKFPAYAKESLGRVAGLAKRDGSLFPAKMPYSAETQAMLDKQHGYLLSDADRRAQEGEAQPKYLKTPDAILDEHLAAITAVGKDVYDEAQRRIALPGGTSNMTPEEAVAKIAQLDGDIKAAERNENVAYDRYSQRNSETYQIRNMENPYRLPGTITRENLAGLPRPGSEKEFEAIEHDRQKAYAEVRAMRDEYERLAGIRKTATEAQRTFLNEDKLAAGRVALRVLGEIRPFGIDKLVTGKVTNAKARDSFLRATTYYPTEWYQRAFGKVKMDIGVTTRMPYCSSNLAKTYTPGRVSSEEVDSTSVHETGHFMEHFGGRSITASEYTFLEHRIGADEKTVTLRQAYKDVLGQQTYTRKIDANSPTYEDKFSHPYMGKQYGTTLNSSYELLTMGMENMRNASNNSPKTDEEYKQWVLGMLATL